MNSPPSLRNLTHVYASHITAFEVVLMERFCRLRSFPWISTGIFLLAFNDSHLRMVTLSAALAIGLSVLLFMGVKNLIGRPRPFESWRVLTCLMAPPDKFSFPSGHTMTAFSVWGALFVGTPTLSFFYLGIAIFIGLSRVFLGLHYPTDVLVGAILGSGIGLGIATCII